MFLTPLPSGFKDKYGKNLFRGIPYVGKVYDRKEKDPEEMQPVLVHTVHVKQFDLSKEADMKEWTELSQRVADGVSQISFEERHYDEALKSWRVLVRWMDLAYTHPEGV